MTLANDAFNTTPRSFAAATSGGPRAWLPLGDVAVQGSIVLLSVAAGFALYRHGDLAFAAASTAALAVGATLLLFDFALRRRSEARSDARRLAALEARLRDLSAQRVVVSAAGEPAAVADDSEDLAAARDGQRPQPVAEKIAPALPTSPVNLDAVDDEAPYAAVADEDHDAAVDDLVRRLAEGFDAESADFGAGPTATPAPRLGDNGPAVATESAAVLNAASKAERPRHRALQDFEPASQPQGPTTTVSTRAERRASISATEAAERELAGAIERAIADGEIDLHLQPIARLGDRKARFYEVFPRLRDSNGETIKSADYRSAALSLGRAPDLEESILSRTFDLLQKLSGRGKAKPFFFTLSRVALADAGARDRILALLNEHLGLVEYMVLELNEADLIGYGETEHDTLAAFADAGLVFAMRDPQSLDFDVDWLRERGFSFVKAPAALLIACGDQAAGLGVRLGQAGLQLVVEDITDEITFAHAQSVGAVLGQGGLFSDPRPVRPELLT